MDFFTNYESLCKERNSTATAVAKILGFSSATVNRWRYGAIPSGKKLNALADYFNVSVDYLLGNTDIRNAPYNQSPKEIAMIVLFGSDIEVSEDMWNEVLEYAEYVKSKHRRKGKDK